MAEPPNLLPHVIAAVVISCAALGVALAALSVSLVVLLH